MGDESRLSTGAGEAGRDLKDVGIGMLGYAFMGKAHTNAYRKVPYIMNSPAARPDLVGICGRSEPDVKQAANRFGFEKAYTDWNDLIHDDEVDVLDNGGPNSIHAEPCIAAAEAGTHVFCEKPLARDADEAKKMLDAVEKTDVKHMVAFNYRFLPAIRKAYELIQSGELGEIYHFRARYLQDWGLPHFDAPREWRFDQETAGSGALGDLGAHIIDLGRFLVGDVESVSAMTRTFTDERPLPDGGTGEVDVDDAFTATVAFENGAIGTLEASRFAAGRKNYEVLEINGEHGSISFNLEQLNELDVYWTDSDKPGTEGFSTVNMTEPDHPFMSNWWPPGHIIGWEHALVHEVNHFLDCVVNDDDVGPYGATFEDGYEAAKICDAVVKSAEVGERIQVE